MRNVILFILFSLFLILSCNEAENDSYKVSEATNDPDKVFERARNHYQKGNYEAALKDHIWFHDNALKYEPALYGVRLSALFEWVELGEKYPPALSKLKEIRDTKTDRIISGDGSFSLFHDVESINSHLGESKKTVQLFKTILNKYPALANECYRVAKEALVEYEEFEICNRFINDPLNNLKNIKGFLASDIKMYKGTDREESHIDWTINHYLEEAEQVVLILVKNNRIGEAKSFLSEASKGHDIQKINKGLKDIENKYLANKAMNSD